MRLPDVKDVLFDEFPTDEVSWCWQNSCFYSRKHSEFNQENIRFIWSFNSTQFPISVSEILHFYSAYASAERLFELHWEGDIFVYWTDGEGNVQQFGIFNVFLDNLSTLYVLVCLLQLTPVALFQVIDTARLATVKCQKPLKIYCMPTGNPSGSVMIFILVEGK